MPSVNQYEQADLVDVETETHRAHERWNRHCAGSQAQPTDTKPLA